MGREADRVISSGGPGRSREADQMWMPVKNMLQGCGLALILVGTFSAASTQRVVDQVVELDDTESLLQMSKWSWQGDIPADGIPHAPNTPHSTSGDELFKDAMGKAEKMAGGTTATAAAQSDAVSTAAEKAAPEAASKGAEKQAAVEIKDSKKQIEEDTKAMNGAKDQKEALRFAKKIEDSKKALDTSEKKEVKAQTQEAENKIAKEENKLLSKKKLLVPLPQVQVLRKQNW